MSNLLEQASLVLIPSGYKEDVVYSEIPINGAGDMSFTRASNGTRINSQGLVEVCPWNMLSNSEEFTNANGWFANITGGSSATFTANYGVAPNGTNTADRLQLALNAGPYADWVAVPTLPIVVGQTYTYSIYMKALSGTPNLVYFGIGGGVGNRDATITGEWVRYSTTFTALATDIYPRFLIQGGTSTSADFLAWGAQLNIGSTAKPYFPTTDRLNVPRLTYQNGGGGCPSLLLEKQSTNLYLYSEQLNLWSTFGSPTITANDATSPDGTINADRVQFSGSGNLVYNGTTGSAGTNVLTVYAKAKTGTAQKFRFFANGTIDYSSDLTATDQWQRFEFVYTYAAVTAGLAGASTGASDVLFWGFQHEVSSYATSYIGPTTSSSATRVADACFKTGISSLIGQTEGVIFADVNLDQRVTQTYFAIATSATAVTNYIGISFRSGTIIYEVVTGAVVQATATLTNSSTGQFKLAIGYKANDFVFYVNGTQIGTDNSGTVPACNDLVLYNSTFGQSIPMKYNEVVLFPTRLTNAELQALTTL